MTERSPTHRKRPVRHGRGRPRPRVRRGPSSGPTRRPRSSSPRTAPSRAELEALSRRLQWDRPAARAAPPVVIRPIGPLSITMVGWEFPPNHTGGLGVHVFELCQELTRLGHRVTFLTPFHGPFTPVEGVSFRWPGDAPRGPDGEIPYAYAGPSEPGAASAPAMRTYNEWIAEVASEHPPDILHVHDWFGTVGAAEAARRTGRPLVMTVHSTEYDRSLGHPWTEILAREQSGVDAADRVIAVSEHLKRQLVDRYHADPRKVRVIYNAVRPTGRLAPLEGSRAIVLYLGRLAAMKGVDTFLRAAARAAPSVPGCTFVVAGSGPEYPRLLTLAAHLGIADRVLFLGQVTEEERDLLLASATVFVLPSVVEPFGIAALEAMAAGVPAIVSKTSGVAEIATSVFAVDFWDVDEFASRIVELLQYPVLRHALGSGGRSDALREGWPERAIQTVQVYAELLRPAVNPT